MSFTTEHKPLALSASGSVAVVKVPDDDKDILTHTQFPTTPTVHFVFVWAQHIIPSFKAVHPA